MRMSPASAPQKPAIIRSSVVLPQPDGPRIEKNCPARRERHVVDGKVAAEALGDAIDVEVGLDEAMECDAVANKVIPRRAGG